MQHQQWHAGGQAVRAEGTKLLGYVAPALFDAQGESAVASEAVEQASQYKYQIVVNPPPPGGATTVVADGVIHNGECPSSLREQGLFFDILTSAEVAHAL
jgi:hypothetical protein